MVAKEAGKGQKGDECTKGHNIAGKGKGMEA